MPPRALAEVAVAASAPPPLLPEPPPLDAAGGEGQPGRHGHDRGSQGASSHVSSWWWCRPRQGPDGPGRAAWSIVADGAPPGRLQHTNVI